MLLITCPFGLTSLLTTEIKRMGIQPQDSFPNGCRIDSNNRKDIITINLCSRLANKVFLQLKTGKSTNFEDLFQLTQQVDWSEHIKPRQGIQITATTNKSILHADRTIQSIVQKAIYQQLSGSEDGKRHIEEEHVLQIYVYIENNIVHIMKNTSGDSLHARGRRSEQGDAPIKENLAVATLLSASRPFQQPLWDPCCGSGTLVIEAARLARNICPGKERIFAFQQFPDYPAELFEQIRQQQIDKEIHDKTWTIIGSDINKELLQKAKINAKVAGVDDVVQFKYHDIMQKTNLPELQSDTTIICNPPYDKRLQDHDTYAIHQRLATLLTQQGRNGAVISGFEQSENTFPLTTWKRKETRQGKERCYIYVPKRN